MMGWLKRAKSRLLRSKWERWDDYYICRVTASAEDYRLAHEICHLQPDGT